jgi:hypothetical protein
MLTQAYYAGGQLPADQHGQQLFALVTVAAKMRHAMLRQWANETLQLAEGLPQQGGERQQIEQGTLSALADVDAAEALRILNQLAPAAVAGNQIGTQTFDRRNSAARQVFPKYWKSTREPDLNAVRGTAIYLGETGQYPFAAVGLILKDVGAKDRAGAEMLFLDAMQYYQRQQASSIQAHIDFRSLLQAARGIVPDAMLRAAIEASVSRLLKEAEEPPPKGTTYVGRHYTPAGFIEPRSNVEDTLFRLMGLIREFAPALEKTIQAQLTHLAKPVPSDVGALPDDYFEVANLIGPPDGPALPPDRIAELRENARGAGARRLAATDPEAALRLANTLTNPELRASTIIAIAEGKLKEIDPERAAKLIAEVESSGIKPPSDRPSPNSADERAQLAALVTLARGQASRDDPELWNTLNRGLDLAERVFQEQLKTGALRAGYIGLPDWQGPTYSPVFTDAISLIKIGVERQTVNTLGWLAQQREPLLKSFLLIAAADGLWNKQQVGTAGP